MAEGEEITQTSPVAPPTTPCPSWFWNPARGLCRIYTTTRFDLKVHGKHSIPKRGGALLISNHQSYLDPVLLGVQIERQISFIAKSELFEHPALSWLIKMLNSFPVRRGQSDVSAMKEALRRIHEGQILTMFPEGTRSVDGNLLPMQPGIALLVKRAQVPVIPAVIDGSYRAWPRRSKFPLRHPIRMMYGPALNVSNMKGSQIVEHIRGTFEGMLRELRSIHPELKRPATSAALSL
jgi:1-acyl-sn-glycerol-3-phosphate acyltransferase